ncbi:hypothetical protein [Soonwooa sp.]|uniref:hypothetical protein n=1 Tax=Soonwooa sp. TaxID=1938592 RepID=UPI0026136746|nr:hypothetical protein [Soonwooa sp.]
MKIILIIITIFTSQSLYSQGNTKPEIIKTLLKEVQEINHIYKSNIVDKNLKLQEYFTDIVYCDICEKKIGDLLNPKIENRTFIQNNLIEVINLLDVNKLKKGKYLYDTETKEYTLSYLTAAPNKKTGFEGGSAIIYFEKFDGKFKICRITTIP